MRITPEALEGIATWPTGEAELYLYRRLQHLDETTKYSYAEIGIICNYVDAHLLWQAHEGCASFPAWLTLAAPWSSSWCFAAMRDVESLADMPLEEVAKIPASNFPLVSQLSTAVRNDPEVIRVVQTQKTAKATEYINQRFPEQHIQTRKTLRFTLDADAAERVEAVLAQAMAQGAKNMNEALELIAEEAREVWKLEGEVKQAVAKGDAYDSEEAECR